MHAFVNDNLSAFSKHYTASTRPHHNNTKPKHNAHKGSRGSASQASAIGDSGTTHNLLRAAHAPLLSDLSPCTNLRVSLPNGESITSSHIGKLSVSDRLNTTAYLFPDSDLQQSLISLSTLCNEHNCTVILTRSDITISQGSDIVFHGSKQPTDTLWLIDLDKFVSKLLIPACNLAYKTDTDAEFVAFVHASFGSPTLSTFQHAVRMGWLSNYPRLTSAMVAANCPHSIATAKGHLDQTRQVKKSRQHRRLQSPSSIPESPTDPPSMMI